MTTFVFYFCILFPEHVHHWNFKPTTPNLTLQCSAHFPLLHRFSPTSRYLWTQHSPSSRKVERANMFGSLLGWIDLRRVGGGFWLGSAISPGFKSCAFDCCFARTNAGDNLNEFQHPLLIWSLCLGQQKCWHKCWWGRRVPGWELRDRLTNLCRSRKEKQVPLHVVACHPQRIALLVTYNIKTKLSLVARHPNLYRCSVVLR